MAPYVSRHGCVESFELAYAVCRFDGCAAPRAALGCATLTDGVWAWPEGLTHYIDAHGVRPPAAFVEHVRAVARAAGVLSAALPLGDAVAAAAPLGGGEGGAGDAQWPLRHHLWWDAAAGAPVPLPRGTAAHLARVSTLHTEAAGGSVSAC